MSDAGFRFKSAAGLDKERDGCRWLVVIYRGDLESSSVNDGSKGARYA